MAVFWNWWQTLPLSLEPIAFFVGSLPVYWYALFFLAGAFLTYHFGEREYVLTGFFSKDRYRDFAFGVFVSALLGAKVGFLLFYWYPFFLSEKSRGWLGPSTEGLGLPGMSFFGGFLAVVLYLVWFAQKKKQSFFQLSDRLVIFLPIAILFGRLGNFFHGELQGRITETPWGMYFPGEVILRHPSTLYAAFLEGVVLFCILFLLRKKKVGSKITPGSGRMSAWFLVLYGILRFFSEFFREADTHIGYIGPLTLNQIFALLIFALGIAVFSSQKAKK